jgi:hypothetical protein
MADTKTALPGADKMPGGEKAAKADKATPKVCYNGCSINLGGHDDNDGKPKLMSLVPGQDVTVAMQKEIGSQNMKNLMAMGRLVEADSTEAEYIKRKVEQEAAAAAAANAGVIAQKEAELAVLKDREIDPKKGAKR